METGGGVFIETMGFNNPVLRGVGSGCWSFNIYIYFPERTAEDMSRSSLYKGRDLEYDMRTQHRYRNGDGHPRAVLGPRAHVSML